MLRPTAALAADWRDVTDDRLLNADRDAANWLMYNRTYSGWRYSPLDQVTTANVKKLVPKFIFAGGTVGDQQTTPIVNDGVMFTTSTALAFNRVHALNAVTGEPLWRHERRIPEDVGALVRVIPHNRGVALHKDRVIFSDRRWRRSAWIYRECQKIVGASSSFSSTPLRVFRRCGNLLGISISCRALS